MKIFRNLYFLEQIILGSGERIELLSKTVSGIVLVLFLTGMLTAEFNVQPASGTWTGTVYIRVDGSVDQSDAPITTHDNITYTLTGDIASYADGIVVERDNIVIDGNRCIIQGTGEYPYSGIDLSNRINVTIQNINIQNFRYGILLSGSSYNRISGNNITANNEVGIALAYSFYNSISGNNITANNYYGIYFYYSYNNSMVGNNIANNSLGICLGYSSNNRISGNNIMANSWEGVRLVKSSYISVSGNVFTNNGLVVLDSYGNVVEDNLVNGKPLVYLEDASNLTIEDAGQVILINCDGITLENLNLTHTDKAIQLRNTNNTKITNNNITNNYDGILLSGSSYNSIAGNNITNNRYGISPFYSSNNAIYHNNFVDNAWQVDYWESVNVWDCGYLSGGNYWSDYTGVDLHNGQNQDLPGSDGIGDTEYVISMDNIDRYPLMAPFNTFEAGVWNGVAYSVDVVSNSTVSAFHFNPMEGPFLRFNVTGKDGTAGFCRITIPKDLLWVEDGWTITVGNQQITDYTIIPNENYTYLYFTYNHSTQTVTIQGTTVIPELPSTIILPTFMLLSTLATIFAKKKATKKKQN